MKVPNDVVNIVRNILYCKKIKECNREYYRTFEILCNCIQYRYCNYNINYRPIERGRYYYREVIVNFLTNTPTIYKVPKNY